MNILYTLQSGTPGGMEQYVLNLVVGMVERGHTVFVWCLDGDVVSWYRSAGAHVTVRKINFEIDPFYICALAKFLKKYKIDVIHTNELKAGVNGLAAAFLAGTKTRISHVHTPVSEWRAPNKLKAFYTGLSGRFYTLCVNLLATREVALTESRRRVKIDEGVKPKKLVVIPNGLDLNQFNIDPATRAKYKNEILARYNIAAGTFIIGNLSRTTEEKGHDVLVRAFANLLYKHPELRDDVKLLIAGGGRLERALWALTKELKVEKDVVITGIFDAQDRVKYYSAFDLFIFPSLAEGFGIVLVEAMYFGLNIICSDLEVLKEVGEDTISYFSAGDALELADKIYPVYLSRNAVVAPSNFRARQRVEHNFTLKTFVDRYFNLYTQSI